MKTFKQLLALLTTSERKRAGALMSMIPSNGIFGYVGCGFNTAVHGEGIGEIELVQTNAVLRSVFNSSRHFGIHTTEQFLFALGVAVFILLLVY